MIRDPFTIFVILAGIVTLAVTLTEKYKWAAKLSVVMWVLIFGAMLSNFGVIPTDAPLYKQMTGFAVPFAVSLILFQVKLSDLKHAGKPLLVAFFIACIGTVVGVLLAGAMVEPMMADVMGEDSWKIAGPYTGTYTGGSLNFVAMWEGLKINNDNLFAAANAVDNITLLPLFLLWTMVPLWFKKYFPVADKWKFEANEKVENPATAKTPFNIRHIVLLTFLALLVMKGSELVQVLVLGSFGLDIPKILFITTFALVLGQIPSINNLKGAYKLGNIAFYFFFAAIGALIDVMMAIRLSPVLFLYVLIIIPVHFGLIYGFGKWLKMDIRILTIASTACKAGPSTVIALTQVKGWHHLTLPGVAMGLLGYAVGNYIAFGTAYAMKYLIGIIY